MRPRNLDFAAATVGEDNFDYFSHYDTVRR